jgi:hypothetical protein
MVTRRPTLQCTGPTRKAAQAGDFACWRERKEKRMSKPLDVKNTRIQKSQFHSVDMSGSVFEDVNLSGCMFRNVNLGNCDFNDISFAGTVISGSCLNGAEIPHGPIGDLKIAGVTVKDLLEAYKKVHGKLPETPRPERLSLPHH